MSCPLACRLPDLPGCQLNHKLNCGITGVSMKRTAISMAMLLSLLVCYAQGNGRGTLELSAGPSFPFGEFSYTQTTFEGSGYAQNGISFAISFKYRLKAQLGLVAMISEHILGVDESTIAGKYWQPEFGYNWTVESRPWISSAYLGGLDIILPMYRSDFYFRFLGGFASTRLPGLSGSAYNFQREVTKDLAAAWSIGSGLNYQDFEKVTLSFGFDFFVTNPVLDEAWSSDLTPPGSGKIFQNIVIFKLTAGLGFRIF